MVDNLISSFFLDCCFILLEFYFFLPVGLSHDNKRFIML